MIKPEQVPPEAMNALLQALRQRRGGREAIAAALNAWPGMHILTYSHLGESDVVRLPLTQEKTDDNSR